MHPAFIALGQAISDPLYRRYFRVISQGHEHLPASGPAVVAGNHSGNIPLDGMMIWADVLRKTQPPRVVRAIADHFVPSLPWVGTLFARGGMIGGSRGNVRAALENGDLLLIFPEGVPGIIKPWKDRYQLRPFRVGHAELAIRGNGGKGVSVSAVPSAQALEGRGRPPLVGDTWEDVPVVTGAHIVVLVAVNAGLQHAAARLGGHRRGRLGVHHRRILLL